MTSREQPRSTETIGTEMVKHVALLVRLGITEEEAREFSHQFNAIIDYFHLLNEVDTASVPPANTTRIPAMCCVPIGSRPRCPGRIS